MSTKDYINRRRAENAMAHIMVTSKIHPDADCYDIELFGNWLKMAIKEGPERIKVVLHPTEANKWVVTVLDKTEA